jgi:hypothetical protein
MDMTSVMEGTMATVDTRTVDAQTGVSVEEHEQTFHALVTGMGIFAAHVFVILALLAAFA